MSIPYANLFFALLLLALSTWLLWKLDRSMLRCMGIATCRMAVQLAVLTLCTWLLWHFNKPWLSVLWLLVMTAVTAFVMISRARLDTKRLFLPVAAGVLAGTAVVEVYLLLLVFRPDHPWAPQWLIPVGGILLAHVLTTVTPAVHTYFEKLRTDSLPYYTALGNGASRMKALIPYASRAIRAIVQPTAANLTVTALFAMPMLLAGMLMGGLQPLTAAVLFAGMLVGCITASMLTLIAILWLCDRCAFDRRGQLLV